LRLNNFAPQPIFVTRSFLFILLACLLSKSALAQADTVAPAPVDTVKHVRKPVTPARHDSTITGSPVIIPAPRLLIDTSWKAAARSFSGRNFIRVTVDQNAYFGFASRPLAVTSDRKLFRGKEVLFYTLIAILLFFAFIRSSFPKYFGDLFRVAFRTTLKQRQIGEQLVQTPLPSLLLNIFFLISSSFYVDLVLSHYHLAGEYNFWVLFCYCFIGLAGIYVLKFVSLKFSGWLFNISAATDSYIFIVFLINKIIGIYVLPFLVLLAFTENNIYQAAFALSYLGVFGLLGYRFVLSYGLVQSQIRLNPFHFFIYLCAFEIIPLLLIYKALLLWF
jgi:Domain of unknown function (DUF4271)